MKIGLIGAGKMGFTLGKHLKNCQKVKVIGYYSKTTSHAYEAAKFTDTKCYEELEALVMEADVLILTVPDGQITTVFDEMLKMGDLLDGKILCHTSGALTSNVFSGLDDHIYGYSIHPIYAVNSKTESYINFSECFITIEGHEKYREYFVDLFESLGHKVKVLDPENKAKYHCSAVFASNLVVGLYKTATDLLVECGFTEEEATTAIAPLFKNNADNLVSVGPNRSLTGPVARFDLQTVEKHLNTIDTSKRLIYASLSKVIAKIARENAEDKDNEYNELIRLLDKMGE